MKDQMRREDKLTVVAKDPIYHFAPSNPWAPVGGRNREHVEVDLAPTMARRDAHADRDDLAVGREANSYPFSAKGCARPHAQAFEGERTRVFIDAGKRRAILIPAAYLYRRAGVNYVKLAGGDEVVAQPGEPREVDGVKAIEILAGLDDGDGIVMP